MRSAFDRRAALQRVIDFAALSPFRTLSLSLSRQGRTLVTVVAALLVASAIGLALWSFWFEPRRLVTREVAIRVPHWPAANDGVRIAVLSDLHTGSPHHGIAKLRDIVARTNRLQPDLVLLLGDLVIQGMLGANFVAPELIAAELGKLHPPQGTYAVLGNHDWWLDATRVATALWRAGITVLEDSAAKLEYAERRFWLAGVSDFWEGRHDVQAALRSVPVEAPVLVFTHNPDILPLVPARVTLTFAGHTHGGQVNLPLIGRPVIPSRYGQRYAAGHVVDNGRHLYVTTGTGTSSLSVRFRVPPEIVIATLHSENTPKSEATKE